MQGQKPPQSRPSPGQFFRERPWEGAKSEPSPRSTNIKLLLGTTKKLHEKCPWEAMARMLPYIGLKKFEKRALGSSSGPGLQLIFSIAMRGHHSAVREVLESRNKKLPEDFFVNLMKDKILSGMRILDLGCGDELLFARCARRFGAEVYTVDRGLATEFTSEWDPRTRGKEIAQHICLDLTGPDAFYNIMKATSGRFDLLTSSCIGGVDKQIYSQDSLKEYLSPLLNEGGFILNGRVLLRSSRLFLKEGGQFVRIPC